MQPQVIIDNEVYRKIMHWVNKSDHEVSGLGMVTIEPDGLLRVTHAMLLPQVNTGTSTDIEPEDAAKMLYTTRDLPGDLRFWWHSHVDMNVFWSGTDMGTIKKLGQGGWFLSTVFNKKREMRSAFYSVDGTRTPWGTYPLFQDSLSTSVEPFIENLAEQWDAEYGENVRARVYPSHFQQHAWAGRLPGPLGSISTLLESRPHGMSKAEWKRIRKSRKAQEKYAGEPPAILPLNEAIMQTPLKSSSFTEVTDILGFTQGEHGFLLRSGWSAQDIEKLYDKDVSPHEMLALAGAGHLPEEVMEMIAYGWEARDIIDDAARYGDDADLANDDAPVMDQSQGGKYDFS